MNKKESVFISAVLYLSDFANDAEKFTRNLLDSLKSYFDHYEIIIVDDCSTRHERFLKEVLPSLADESTITLVHMSVKQGIEACLRAGLDVSIGDFVFEFDTLEMIFDKGLLWDVYQESLKGNDVVSVEPKQNNVSRSLFYRLFNKYSNADYDINASAFRLVSRRAINRVLELNMSSAFRQAVYASCGLKNSRIEYKGSASPRKARGLSLAIDSFLLYTEFSKNVCTVSLVFILVLISAGIVGISVGLGWLFSASVLIGLALILVNIVFLLYYARLISKEKDSKYLISNIEKVQKG
ncbi:MAG: glycosyltransferase [Oscillospiraceae bacterium]|nr:glycosyltransferase [Oscillospiraceae bacterium]